MKTLEERLDDLNEDLRRAEQVLLVGAHVSASVGKHNGSWGVFVIGPTGEPQPLRSASMLIRCLAALRLEELAAEMRDQEDQAIRGVEVAVEAVALFLRKRNA
jgi:hypothetical protein